MRRFAFVLLLVFLAACARQPAEPRPAENVTGETPVFLNPGYHEIVIKDFKYNPKSLTVYQGDRVKWINQMPFVKSVWIWGVEENFIISPGKSWSHIFTEPGFYKYRDRFAQDMEGNITVLPYEERPDIKAKLEAEQ